MAHKSGGGKRTGVGEANRNKLRRRRKGNDGWGGRQVVGICLGKRGRGISTYIILCLFMYVCMYLSIYLSIF